MKVLAFDGRHKIADTFEQDAHEVFDQTNLDIPVYNIRALTGRERTLHRNHVLITGTIDNGPAVE